MKNSDFKIKLELSKLLRRNDIWRCSDAYKPDITMKRMGMKNHVDTGYNRLNQLLLGGGWPLGGLVELTQSSLGNGEWQLISPALYKLNNTTGCIGLINPPEEPYAPSLLNAGLKLSEILIITPKNRADTIASFVDLLKSSACKSVLLWETQTRFKTSDLRRLQLAAMDSKALCFLFRKHNTLSQNSPAVLRVLIEISAKHINVELVKQRGSFNQAQCELPLPDSWNQLPDLCSQEWLTAETPQRLSKATVLTFQNSIND